MKRKKLLSGLLAAIMVLSLVPAYALASTGTASPSSLETAANEAEAAANAAKAALNAVGTATSDLGDKEKAVEDAAKDAANALDAAITTNGAAESEMTKILNDIKDATTSDEKVKAIDEAIKVVNNVIDGVNDAVAAAEDVVTKAEEVAVIAKGTAMQANTAVDEANKALAAAENAEQLYHEILQETVDGNPGAYRILAEAENKMNAAWNSYAEKQWEADSLMTAAQALRLEAAQAQSAAVETVQLAYEEAEAAQAIADQLFAEWEAAEKVMQAALTATGDADLQKLEAYRAKARDAALSAQQDARQAIEKAVEVYIKAQKAVDLANNAVKAVDDQSGNWHTEQLLADLSATDLREWETKKGYTVKDAIHQTGSQHNKYTKVDAGAGYLNKRYQDKENKKYYVKDEEGKELEAVGNGNNYVNLGAGKGDLVIIQKDIDGKSYAIINGNTAMMKGHYANVGAGNGSYNYVKGVWEFVGEGTGEYLPGDGYGFVIVGEGNGDYRKLVDGYLNVGAGKGEYIATAPGDLIAGYMDEDGDVIQNADLEHRFHSFVRLYTSAYHKNIGYQVNMPDAADLEYLVFKAKNGEWFIWSNGKRVDDSVEQGLMKKFGLTEDKYRKEYNFSGTYKNDNVLTFDMGNGKEDWAQYWVEEKDYGYEIHIVNRNTKDKDAPNYQGDCMDGEDVLSGLYRVYGAPAFDPDRVGSIQKKPEGLAPLGNLNLPVPHLPLAGSIEVPTIPDPGPNPDPGPGPGPGTDIPLGSGGSSNIPLGSGIPLGVPGTGSRSFTAPLALAVFVALISVVGLLYRRISQK